MRYRGPMFKQLCEAIRLEAQMEYLRENGRVPRMTDEEASAYARKMDSVAGVTIAARLAMLFDEAEEDMRRCVLRGC